MYGRTISNHAVDEPWMQFPGKRVRFQEGTVATIVSIMDETISVGNVWSDY